MNRGQMKARSQAEHEAINRREYPGTRQLCERCGEPTERCEDDSIHTDSGEGPLCIGCYNAPIVGQCEDCAGTGWYGDNGPGIPGNSEIVRCDCAANAKCRCGYHKYREIAGIPWCDECGLEADLSVCKLTHRMPNKELSTTTEVNDELDNSDNSCSRPDNILPNARLGA